MDQFDRIDICLHSDVFGTLCNNVGFIIFSGEAPPQPVQEKVAELVPGSTEATPRATPTKG